jgi:uncharacterized protein
MSYWLGIMVGILLLGCTPMMATPTHTESKYIAQAPTMQGRGQNLPISAYATIAGRKFELEVAKTPQQQQIGLMYRTSLADNRGMLFVFASPQPTRFWMKNTLIPLDMIFLREGQVIAIETAVPPCKTTTCPTYGTDTAIDRVIELKSGTTAQIGLKVGDRVKIQYID